jgi:hypothetical protein
MTTPTVQAPLAPTGWTVMPDRGLWSSDDDPPAAAWRVLGPRAPGRRWQKEGWVTFWPDRTEVAIFYPPAPHGLDIHTTSSLEDAVAWLVGHLSSEAYFLATRAHWKESS